MDQELSVSRISGTSGGIVCLLPFIQSKSSAEFDKKVRKSIVRELFSSNPFQEMFDYFKSRIFHYQIHPDLSLDIQIDASFIRKNFLSFNSVSEKRLKETDIIVSVTAVKDNESIESKRFNISEMVLKNKDPQTASKIIQASASIFSVSDPVEYEENGKKHFLLDGFYTDNVPMSEMFEEKKYSIDNNVDVIFVINNSNLKNFKSFMDILSSFRKDFGGMKRYSYQYKSMLHYIETSMILAGSDKEQIDLSLMINQMIRSKLKETGQEESYGARIRLKEYNNKEFTLKPVFVIEPEEKNEDIALLVSGKDGESVAIQNYELGKRTLSSILKKIQNGELKPY